MRYAPSCHVPARLLHDIDHALDDESNFPPSARVGSAGRAVGSGEHGCDSTFALTCRPHEGSGLLTVGEGRAAEALVKGRVHVTSSVRSCESHSRHDMTIDVVT